MTDRGKGLFGKSEDAGLGVSTAGVPRSYQDLTEPLESESRLVDAEKSDRQELEPVALVESLFGHFRP
jgi:hypothetical protein